MKTEIKKQPPITEYLPSGTGMLQPSAGVLYSYLMKYFLHDTSAFDDEKITMLFINYGYEGIGLFYTLLEKIAKQEKPVNTQVLKSQLKIGKRLEKCWNFMEEIGIICSSNGETFNKQLLNFSEKYQIKKEKNREKVFEWRKNQEDKKIVTGNVPPCNPPKVKVSKVKIKKEYKEKEFTPPSKAEIIEYFTSNQYPESEAVKFYDYYTAGNWTDRNGKAIKNWKLKAVGVWFDEKKKQPLPKFDTGQIPVPDNVEQVKLFFHENGYRFGVGNVFFEQYEKSGWTDKYGNPITNWKNLARKEWFTEEHKPKSALVV